ncbi:MAG: hypothetical protein HY826_12300 [Actinobacteria bacterium]|nr:hypothetical protein [Actinomycetota bacterium]
MNEFNDIDRDLQAAFAQRPAALSRPSLRDVKDRARRHQRQRRAAVLSACALAGVGGVTALAKRSPGSETTVGQGLGGDATTTYPTATTICYAPVDSTVAFSPTTLTETTWTESTLAIVGSYTLVAGDFPGVVAERFGVTVRELDAINEGTEGYGDFIVGTQIFIPLPGAFPSATTTTSAIYDAPCSPLPAANFRCSGEPQVGDDGWWYFEYCEGVTYPRASDPTWPSISTLEETTVATCVELPIMTLPLPATTTTMVVAC